MKIFNGIKKVFAKTKESLLTYGGESFSTLSIVLIIFLDIFILTAVFNGINAQKHSVLSMYEKFPYTCSRYFNADRNLIDKYEITTISLPASQYKFQEVEPLCIELNGKILDLLKNKKYSSTAKRYNEIDKELKRLSQEIKTIEARYNTTLFEKAAYIQSNNLVTTKTTYDVLIGQEKTLQDEQKNLADITKLEEFKTLERFIKNNIQKFQDNKDSYYRTKAFLDFLNVLKFTLPLILIFYFIYRRSEGSESTVGKLGVLISSHTILINSIPLFLNTLYLIYHAIPKVFFTSIIKFLYAIGGIFLGYYFLIALGIMIFAIAILFVQKRYRQKQEELKQRNIDIGKKLSLARSTCPNCLNNIRIDQDIFCPHCAAQLKELCKYCGNKRYSFTKYCQNCGKE